MAKTFSLADVYQSAEAIRGARTRNAYAESELARERRLDALSNDPNTTPDQYARVGRSDIANSLLNSQRSQDVSRDEAIQQLAGVARQALQLDPVQRRQLMREAMQVYEPAFRAISGGKGNAARFDYLSDQELEQAAQRLAAFGEQVPQQGSGFSLSPGETRFDASGRQIASVAPAPEKPKAKFRPMTPEEVANAGLPPGTAAQVNDDTGQISVLSKRDATAGLSQKDQTTAKMKLTTVKLARQQLNSIRQRFGNIKGTAAAGAFGQGRLPTEGGRAFDRAVDQMRSTLTALTRVPGVGAMSDYETKLDQAKFPTRQEYESVTEQQIGDLDSMLNAIETGYLDLLSGAPPATAAQAAPTAPATPRVTATGPNGQKIELVNGQWVPVGN